MGVVTLEDVDRQIGNGFRLLRFAPAIEAAFLRDYAATGSSSQPFGPAIGTLIYDMVFFGDATMMAERVLRTRCRAVLESSRHLPCSALLALRRWPTAGITTCWLLLLHCSGFSCRCRLRSTVIALTCSSIRTAT